ncbi:hypothetical protein LA080_015216 [Diaporthe eres]|uniref:Stress activated map kinase interacting n=1 Tax=Diaporthe vaccinii TaxID=105482 RepID=A0ABR4F001_9PEZI|nr:hypothetical protein LA080_015216 [Diaporthe eres]
MGLVEYSDSESDSESPQTPAHPTAAAAAASQPGKKQRFQKLVDKSNPGKILVSLPSVSTTSDDAATSETPAAKRLKTSGSRFSGFSSFLPPPKATASNPRGGSIGKATPRVGVNLRTSSEAAFSRDTGGDSGDGVSRTDGPGSISNSPSATATAPAQPSIPPGQKSEDEVKLVGKPLMFKPLSVARKPGKKAVGTKAAAASTTASHGGALKRPSDTGSSGPPTKDETLAVPQAKKKKRISLFSVVDDARGVEQVPEDSTSYEAEPPGHDQSTFNEGNALDDYASQQQYAGYSQPPAREAGYPDPTSLDSIADDLNLGPAARRELFGRGGAPSKTTAKSVINFNLDQEYRHNEELRQSGALDQQQHNPLRAIKPGKHSLQQLVNQVQSQRDALEENFAKNRATQKQSGAKYGF